MIERQTSTVRHGSASPGGEVARGPTASVSRVAVPSVVVVDPRFDAYGELAAGAREGRLSLHFRGGGGEALRLARRLRVDAWLVATDLDDMSGCDFVELLRRQLGERDGDGVAAAVRDPKVVMVEPSRPGGRRWSVASDEAAASGAAGVLPEPITIASLERLLGLPVEDRRRCLAEVAADVSRAFVALPVSVGAAAVAMVLLFAG